MQKDNKNFSLKHWSWLFSRRNISHELIFSWPFPIIESASDCPKFTLRHPFSRTITFKYRKYRSGTKEGGPEGSSQICFPTDVARWADGKACRIFGSLGRRPEGGSRRRDGGGPGTSFWHFAAQRLLNIWLWTPPDPAANFYVGRPWLSDLTEWLTGAYRVRE